MEIKGSCGQFEIGCKRFYMPGVVVESTCSKCNAVAKQNMGNDYLSYPRANSNTTLPFYCKECEFEWEERVHLVVRLEPAKT